MNICKAIAYKPEAKQKSSTTKNVLNKNNCNWGELCLFYVAINYLRRVLREILVVVIISYINLIAGLLYYFLLDHAYK